MSEQLWSARTIAERMDYEENYVVNSLVFKPGFPSPVKIEGKGHPRWFADEVIAWWRSHQVSAQGPKSMPGNRTEGTSDRDGR
mgnify:CR=1 FL=1